MARLFPVDGAPAPAALGPCNTADKAVQLVELWLDHDLPGGVDQPPFAVPAKWDEAVLAESADAIGRRRPKRFTVFTKIRPHA